MTLKKPKRPLVSDNFHQVEFSDNPIQNTNTNQEYKQFMSTKISKLSAAQTAKKVENSDDSDDDNELNNLLKSSQILEEIRVEELGGREKRKYLNENLLKFGGKVLGFSTDD
jgi:hypothetical protein